MGKFGQSGQPNFPERLALFDVLTLGDLDTALKQVAILGGPAIGMSKNDAVTALATADTTRVGFQDPGILHPVANASYDAVRRGDHGNSLPHHFKVGDPEVDTEVAVVGPSAAGVVLGARTGVMVEVVLDPADFGNRASDRRSEDDRGRRRWLRLRARRTEDRCQKRGGKDQSRGEWHRESHAHDDSISDRAWGSRPRGHSSRVRGRRLLGEDREDGVMTVRPADLLA